MQRTTVSPPTCTKPTIFHNTHIPYTHTRTPKRTRTSVTPICPLYTPKHLLDPRTPRNPSGYANARTR